MIVDEIDEFLEHHGIKGQKWGVEEQKVSSTSGPKKQSRRDRKELAKQVQSEEIQQKANHLLNTALKDPTVLIKLNRVHIVTGEEFVQHLTNGGLLDVKGSDIYAQKETKEGPYVLK